jgi:hypothetical protein
MSDPEIDRRCSLCGATVRARAAFCPQCGQPTERPTSKAADTQIDLRDTPVVKNYDTVPLIREQIPDLSETQPLSALPITVPPPPPEPKPGPTKVPPAKESTAKGRVDKIRKASSVVIDQAAYDPSLRFVLVAFGFFLLFLVLLIMSKVLG